MPHRNPSALSRTTVTATAAAGKNGLDLDGEIAALRTAVGEELRAARSIHPWPIVTDGTARLTPPAAAPASPRPPVVEGALAAVEGALGLRRRNLRSASSWGSSPST